MTFLARFVQSPRPLPPGLLALLLASLPACSGAGTSQPPAEPAGPRITVPVGSATSAPLVTERTEPERPEPGHGELPWDLSFDSIDRDDELEISIETPLFVPRHQAGSQDEAAAALNRAMGALAAHWNAEFTTHLVDSRQNIAQGLPAFSLHIKCGPVLTTAGLVSIVCGQHSYTGGAHGNHGTFGHAFLIREGSVTALELDDLFRDPPQARQALSRHCVTALERQGAQSIVSGALTDVKHMLDAWAIERAGLRIFFSPYQVAPYADGSFTVLVPMAKLRRLIGPDSPLAPLVRVAHKPPKRKKP